MPTPLAPVPPQAYVNPVLQTLLLVGMLELPSISGAGGVADELVEAAVGEATGSAEAAGDAGEDYAADDDPADDVAVVWSCMAPDELEFVDEHPATPTATSANPTTSVFNRPFTMFSYWVVIGMRFILTSYTFGSVNSEGFAKDERFNRSLLYEKGSSAQRSPGAMTTSRVPVFRNWDMQ